MDTLIYLAARAIDENGIDPDNIDVTTRDPMKIAYSRRYCTVGKCPEQWQTIKYRPNIAGNTIYLVSFFILMVGQLYFGIRYKTWKYMVCVSLGVLGEIAGYVGRIMLNRNPFLMNNFLVNLISLTIAPALLTAGIYLCLGSVIVAIGAEYSRLKPKLYTLIFVGCDLLSLILQAIGGAMAATTKSNSRTGVDIMIAGLISQVVSMAIFFAVWGDFVLRVRRAKATGALARTQPPLYARLRGTITFTLFQWSLFVATILIFIRCIYRVAELWDGFTGYLANHEETFMIFEGPCIILAVLVMTVLHPGRVFGDLWIPAGQGIRSAGKLDTDSSSSVEIHRDGWTETNTYKV